MSSNQRFVDIEARHNNLVDQIAKTQSKLDIRLNNISSRINENNDYHVRNHHDMKQQFDNIAIDIKNNPKHIEEVKKDINNLSEELKKHSNKIDNISNDIKSHQEFRQANDIRYNSLLESLNKLIANHLDLKLITSIEYAKHDKLYDSVNKACKAIDEKLSLYQKLYKDNMQDMMSIIRRLDAEIASVKNEMYVQREKLVSLIEEKFVKLSELINNKPNAIQAKSNDWEPSKQILSDLKTMRANLENLVFKNSKLDVRVTMMEKANLCHNPEV